MLLSGVIIKEDPLFVKGDVNILGGIAYLDKGECLSFDTFYSSFGCNPYLLYTPIEEVSFSFDVLGSGTVEIFCCKKNKKTVGVSLVTKTDFSFDERKAVLLKAPLTYDGVLFAKITALSKVKVFGGEIDADLLPKNDISLSVVFCTFKREKHVIENVKEICDYKALTGRDIDVFVIDNANTLRDDDVKGATLIYNPNLGGSGGFSRGLFEAYNKKKYTHVLLMDDDISFDKEIFDRIFGFLFYVNEVDKIGVGASMLLEENPFIQFELGAIFGGIKLKGLGKNVDLRDLANLIDNANRKDATYCAWWGCVMPMSVVKRKGLPFPMFIKYDDVEYGIRSGLFWAFPSGIGVSHLAFDEKKVPYLEYYISRNELIANAVSKNRWWVLQYLKTSVRVYRNLLKYRYDSAELVLKGYEDFLKGPKFFDEISAPDYHKSLLDKCEKAYTFSELIKKGYNPTTLSPKKKRSKILSFLTFNGKWFANDRVNVVGYNDARVSDFFATKTVLQVNPYTSVGYLTKGDSKNHFRLVWRLIKLGFKSLFRFRKANRLYKRNLEKITSFSFWERQWEKGIHNEEK